MKNLLVLFFVLPAAAGIAQDYDCLCVNDDCGDILSDFSIAGDQSEVCDGFEFFVVNNTVAPDIDQYIWYWGDGSYQVETSPVNVSHIYNIPDSLVCDDDKTTYQICLVIVRECGASEHSCHYTAKGVNVIHRPKAILDTDPQVCVNDPLTLTNASCNAETYTWDFGNGETATGPEPVYSYDTPGTYTVTLTVTNECGEDSTTKQIEVVGFPEAAFDLSLDPANGCEPVTATFEDLSNQWSNT
ncbi:MAG: PKD domain-containing protein, partial [Saprospiraceae bacterium]|nr:PKD domain-containing protein [Saprospiraceae bacterium]